MPVINGVYLKDFTALPGSVADADIIPIAITGNQIAYRTTVAGIVTDARITAKLLTGLSVTGGAVVAADTILQAFGKVQNQINGKQGTITLTTTGTSGAATLISNTLNIPNYGSALTGYVPYTGATTDVDLGAFKLNAQSLHVKGTAGNGHLGLKHQSSSATAAASESSLFADSNGDMSFQNANLYLNKFVTSANSANRTYTFPDATGTVALVGGSGVGTVTSVAAITLGTTGTDLSSTVATGTTTPVITLQVPTASASNRGALSSADWSTFNGKESALTFSSPLVRTVNTISIPVATTSVNGYLSSTDWTTFNNKQATITLTTTGTSGAATLVGSTLNVPNYADGGVLSLSAIGATANANGATITGTVLNLQPADASFGGVVTTGAQTIAGAKTISSTLASTFVGQFFENTGASTSAKLIRISNTSGDLALGLEGATPTEIPIAEGGIAYAGVLKTVGSKSLILGTLSKAALTINTSQQVTLAQGLTGTTANFTGQLTLGSTITNGTYTYTLPSATGTLALTSDIHSAVTLSAIGSTANANGATLTGQVLNLQPASSSFGGVVTTGTQTFAGDKTLTGTLYGIGLSMTGTTADIVQGTATSGKALRGTATTGWGLYASVTTGVGVQGNSSGTGGSGVFGSSVDGYGGIFYNDSTTYPALEVNNNNESAGNIAVFRRVGTSVFIINSLGNISNGTYTYTLPSATGTLALTSALSGYLPLTGGTLTGALSGTSATFSSSVTQSYSVITGAQPGGLGANKSIMDFSGGTARWFSYGADASTNGAFLLNSQRSDGSNAISFLSIASTGAATFSSGISVGGATATTGGIQFPATQVAIASANNLDDYEEGTWTPGFAFSLATTSITYSVQAGTYTKIGRQVTVNGYVQLSSKGSAPGWAGITGLPFTIANTNGNYSIASIRVSAITYTGSIAGQANINGTVMELNQTTEAGVLSDVTNTNFANNSSLVLSLTYFV